ncbi:HNH endonuclease [Cereibacter sphaeroides]|uniref:HNH endonuclease n=1 Tax=Cereibacter sphaeroides TaxID=1063 RepID=UPI001F172A80|nr:HNH endonuclease [Cereibacter sphaeroides]MCE6959657.1 HNH endonuclease [Cereibacter sphaeroides]MCE6974482.1 HNH endonuclease [Cereibacter sphaeroides]
MLSQIVTQQIPALTLGSRAHALLLSGSAAVCAEVFRRDDETCHVCGIRIPGFMEVDHLRGHKPCGAADLRTICTFCHDLRHPLWAAAHRRIIPVHAPELTQQDMTRLAWTIVATRDLEGHPFDTGTVLSDLKRRSSRLTGMLGCAEAEPLFEAAFTARNVMGTQAADPVLLAIDQVLRFVPAEILRRETDPVEAGLSSWRLGGFRRMEGDVAAALLGGGSLDVARLAAAAASVKPDTGAVA